METELTAWEIHEMIVEDIEKKTGLLAPFLPREGPHKVTIPEGSHIPAGTYSRNADQMWVEVD